MKVHNLLSKLIINQVLCKAEKERLLDINTFCPPPNIQNEDKMYLVPALRNVTLIIIVNEYNISIYCSKNYVAMHMSTYSLDNEIENYIGVSEFDANLVGTLKMMVM